MPIVGCGFARYNLNVRFWQNEPNRFLLECPCLDVPTWQTQWHFAPAAAPSATRCERTAAADPAMGVGQYTYRALQVRFALTPHQPDQLLEQCAAKAMYVCDAAFFSNLKEFGRLRVERHSAKKMSEISIAQFKDFDVAADGRKVVLHFTDPDGRPIAIQVESLELEKIAHNLGFVLTKARQISDISKQGVVPFLRPTRVQADLLGQGNPLICNAGRR
jgi:hypothetical protein